MGAKLTKCFRKHTAKILPVFENYINKSSTREKKSEDGNELINQLFPEIKRRSTIMNVGNALLDEGYALGKTLGQGSYGTVKLSLNLQKNTKAAVKIVDLSGVDRVELDYFVQREYKTMTMLMHPNIIRFERGFRVGPCLCLVMELAEGGDLLDQLLKDGPMSNVDAKKVFKGLADAVRYCHCQGVAHRDLKCENILLTRDGQAKLGDFGLVYISTPSEMNQKKVFTDTYCGSLAYVAPEIVIGNIHKTKYNPMIADIWSLGTILYTMVVGALPFMNNEAASALIKERLGSRPSFKSPNAKLLLDINCNCKHLINSMLEPDVMKRLTANEVLHSDWLNIFEL